MKSPTIIHHIETNEEFESLWDAWGQLLEARSKKTIFLIWDWLISMWKIHRANSELWLITAWKDDKLIGAAPLMISQEKKHRLGFRLPQSFGALNTDDSNFLVKDNEPAVIGALLDYIPQNKSRWDALILHELRVGQPSTQTIQEILAQNGLGLPLKPNLHYHIPHARFWGDHFKSLSKNMHKNLECRLRRKYENQMLGLEDYGGPQINWKHFETNFDTNRKGAFPEKIESETERAFHCELLCRFSIAGLDEDFIPQIEPGVGHLRIRVQHRWPLRGLAHRSQQRIQQSGSWQVSALPDSKKIFRTGVSGF